MHRRKDYYGEDAEEFKPERWLDNAETGQKGLRPGWEYLPFNGGASKCFRGCIFCRGDVGLILAQRNMSGSAVCFDGG
jgi:hypothetical protein